jgi:hypothetical protein
VPVVVELRDHSGAVLGRVVDRDGVLRRSLPPETDESLSVYRCLGYVDVDDDTFFNSPQSERLLVEIEAWRSNAPADAVPVFEEIAAMIRGGREHHRYVAFIGE